MYRCVRALLANEPRPERYSMDRETDHKAYLAMDDPLERFYVYKSKNINPRSVYQGAVRYREQFETISQSIADCDSCELSRDVYRILWHKAMADAPHSLISGQHGDTMTSLQHSLNMAFSLIETEEDRRKYFRGKRISLAYQIEILSQEKDFLTRMKSVEGVEYFACIYHTIGNFIPVPPLFNTARSEFGKDDYWDVTLTAIRQWYVTHDDRAVTALLHKTTPDDPAVRCCIQWLQWFGTWPRFIEDNYLQDFIDPATAAPVLFRPRTPRDVSAFFNTCGTLIEQRGVRMIDELKKQF